MAKEEEERGKGGRGGRGVKSPSSSLFQQFEEGGGGERKEEMGQDSPSKPLFCPFKLFGRECLKTRKKGEEKGFPQDHHFNSSILFNQPKASCDGRQKEGGEKREGSIDRNHYDEVPSTDGPVEKGKGGK